MDERSGARLSECGTYRYNLWRSWDTHLPTMTFVMLNPSTADHSINDPTIRRCMGFAGREGCGEISVVNLFAFRTKSPKVLAEQIDAGIDPFGPGHNDFMTVALSQPNGPVVAAWGASPLAALALHKMPNMELVCLGVTKSGAPRHPLYVKSDQPLLPWPSDE